MNTSDLLATGIRPFKYDKESGLTTEYVSKHTKLFEELYMYYAMNSDTDNVFGVMKENIRDFELHVDENKCVTDFTFTHGQGYDWVDKDLLGGDGSGKAQVKFEKEFIDRENKRVANEIETEMIYLNEHMSKAELFENEELVDEYVRWLNSSIYPENEQESLNSRSTQAKQISDEQQHSSDKERDKGKDNKDKGKE